MLALQDCLSQPSSRRVTVDFDTVDGTAIAGVDYEAKSGRVEFPAGQVEQTIAIPILGDHVEESNLSFSLQLSDPEFANLSDSTAVATIVDDDPTLSVSDGSLTESDSGTSSMMFTVNLSKPLDEEVTVEYWTIDAEAVAESDYETTRGELTFAPGETQATFVVPIFGDITSESDESFSVKIGHSNRVNVSDPVGEGLIVDNDPLIRVGDAEVIEGDSGQVALSFPVSLSKATNKTITADFATANHNAISGIDYVAASGTVTFSSGGSLQQTVTVNVIGDTEIERNETFDLQLSNVTGADTEDLEAVGTILSDDGPVFSIDDVSIVEADGWSTYFGAEGADQAYDIALDAEGNFWVAGQTASSAIGKDSVDNTFNGGYNDALIAKFDSTGELLWSRYLGGPAAEAATSITIDDSGHAWVVGWTFSGGWVSGGFDHSHNGDMDAFVAKLGPDGDVIWSSYLGGAAREIAWDVALDSTGHAWIVGDTFSAGWTTGGFDTIHGGGADALLAKIAPDGSLVWSGYFGESGEDHALGITIDPSDNAIIVGQTSSTNLADDGFDDSHNGGWDAIVAKFSSDGVPAWSTYLGGTGTEIGTDITVDAAGDLWVTGDTGSAGWLSGGFDDSHNGGQDGFLAKVSADGLQIPWSTYIGGSSNDYPRAIEMDPSGTLWLAGYSDSAGWVTGGPDDTYGGGGSDGFLVKIDPIANSLDWSTYFGGNAVDQAHGITLDEAGSPWVVGQTNSSGWTAGGTDLWHANAEDTFLAKVTNEPAWHAVYTVSLSEPPTEEMLVDYASRDATATAHRDYLPVTGRLTFDVGEPLQQSIRVPIHPDERHEFDEQFSVELFSNVHGIIAPHGVTTILDEDPLITINAPTVIETDSGTTNAVVEISLTPAPIQTVVVDYQTANGTATAGTDFQSVSGSVTFLPGETTKQVSIPIYGDTVDELDKTFRLALDHVVEGVVSLQLETIMIEDDDDPSISIQDAMVLEDSGQAELVVSLSSAPLETISVDYATADATATSGEDYVYSSGTLTFLPGEGVTKSILVPIIADENDESDETALVNLSNATNAVMDDDQSVLSISDDLPLVGIDDVLVVEGDAGTIDAVFTVILSASSTHPVSVNYLTSDGSAQAGLDYNQSSGTLTFAPGETQKSVTVQVNGDVNNEPNETFSVLLFDAANASISDLEGMGTIVGDDGPLLSIDDVQLVEGDSGTSYMQFTAILSIAAIEAFQVDYETEDGTALANTDYSSVTGTLLFNPGDTSKTLLIPVLGDENHEGDEWFNVRLHNATVVGIADSIGQGMIVGDDPSITIGDAPLTETDSGNPVMSFTVNLSQNPIDPVTVNYSTLDDTATAGVDYLTSSGTLTFLPGGGLQQTIDVNLVGDLNNEVHEQFQIELSNVVNAELGDGQAFGTILDDDGAKLTIADAVLIEGDAGTTDMTVTVSLTQPATQVVTVDYETEDETADGSDYQTISGSLTFDVGTTNHTVTIPIIGDSLDEVDETFLVRLSNAVGVPVLDDAGQATITDDDQATLSVDDVVSLEGFDGWLNSRIWQGNHWITPLTGESYHEMRISGAAAVDDPWLVSGNDIGRFRFQVRTMGVEAMTLHANDEEGHIALDWDQDDFDLLAGYHLYRSSSENGTYSRLNNTIIPVGQESYVDWDVTPAETMYYKFTVVETDMSESDPSNTASSAALDTVSPIITHAPKTAATPNAGLGLSSTVTDNVSVEGVSVHYRPMGSTAAFVTLAANNLTADNWSVTIPGGSVQPPGIEYYLTATDGITQVYHGTAAAPHTVVVVSTPILTSVSPNQGTAGGGTRVTLTGALFQPGATVEFGGVPATDIIVQTSNQILATTPAHYPANVDVRVLNPDLTEVKKTHGYYYVDDHAVLSLPTLTADHGSILDIPISLADVEGLITADLTIAFDPAVLSLGQPGDVRQGTLTSGWTIQTVIPTPGRVEIHMFSQSPMSGSGTIANLQMTVVGSATTQSALSFESAILNDAAITTDLSDGLFLVNGLFSLGGSVTYFDGSRPVPNTNLQLVGVGQQNVTTDAAGTFSFSNVHTGAYQLTPEKDDQVGDISAMDATLILRHVSGLQALTPDQQLAADVNRINGITLLDASYVLQKAVGNLASTFPGAGKYWDFTPIEKNYPLISDDLVNQDFTAILIGDVTGNWNSDGALTSLVSASSPQGNSEPYTLDLLDATGDIDQVVTVLLEINVGSDAAYSADMVFHYDHTRLELQNVTLDIAGANLFWEKNTSQPGEIRVSMAGPQSLTTDGTLLNFEFKIIGALDAPTEILLQQPQIDEGTVPTVASSGFVADTTPPQIGVNPLITNDNTPSISGTVDDPTAQVLVSVAGQSYLATNRGDGTWFLPDGVITTPISDGQHNVQATVTDAIMRTTIDSSGGELTIDTVAPIPQQIVVGDGSGSRSMLNEVVVTFDSLVTLQEGAIIVNRRGDGGGGVDINVAINNSGSQTIATVTFAGSFVENSGSLADGTYDLTINSHLVHDAAQNSLDGNGDGSSGDHHVLGANEVDGFYRFFGDSNGDRIVDLHDLGRFALTMNQELGDEHYDAAFDFDGDGDIDGLDYANLKRRLMRRM